MSGATKFTPGPWVRRSTYGREGKIFDWSIPVDAGPVCLGLIVQSGARPQGEAEANAALIGAAPELYEALQNAIEALAMCTPSTQHGAACHSAAMLGGRAALAKARGEA